MLPPDDGQLYPVSPDDIYRYAPAVIQRSSHQPDPTLSPDTLHQHVRRILTTRPDTRHPFSGARISAAGAADLDFGPRVYQVALLVPPGNVHREIIDAQIVDLHDSGLVGPLCATYDLYECVRPHIRADGTLVQDGPQPGDVRGSYLVWPYRCGLPDCRIPLDTTGTPMAPIGSRFDGANTRRADAHAVNMGWARRTASGRLVCAGHQPISTPGTRSLHSEASDDQLTRL